MNADTVGGRVRWERERRGWRQADLAAMTGLTAATIGNVENDRHGTVRETTLRALASALDVPAEYLRGQRRKRPRPAAEEAGRPGPS